MTAERQRWTESQDWDKSRRKDEALVLLLAHPEFRVDRSHQIARSLAERCASFGSASMFELLLRKDCIDVRCITDGYPNLLGFAVRHGNEGVARVLLSRGFTALQTNRAPIHALRTAKRYGQTAILLALMLLPPSPSLDFDPAAIMEDSSTELQHRLLQDAARFGLNSIVRLAATQRRNHRANVDLSEFY
jgi:hypothetical protein